MKPCPHCRSHDTAKNDLHSGHDAVHAFHATHLIGAVAAVGLWLFKKAADALQDTYKCKSCGKTFS